MFNKKSSTTNQTYQTSNFSQSSAIEDIQDSLIFSNVDAVYMTDPGAFDLASNALAAMFATTDNALAFGAGTVTAGMNLANTAILTSAELQAMQMREAALDKDATRAFAAGAIMESNAQSRYAIDAVSYGAASNQAAIMAATNNALAYGSGAFMTAFEGLREFASNFANAVATSSADGLDAISAFNQATIDKFLSASESDQNKDREKMMKIAGFAIAGVVAVAWVMKK